MIVNNVELPDLDPGDAFAMEIFERQLDVVSNTMSNFDAQGKRRSELIKTQCQTVFEFFNNVFGDGTDKKVFGNFVNLTTCINAFEQVIKNVNSADVQLADAIKTKYKTGNRQQHRQNKKQQKKNELQLIPMTTIENKNSSSDAAIKKALEKYFQDNPNTRDAFIALLNNE